MGLDITIKFPNGYEAYSRRNWWLHELFERWGLIKNYENAEDYLIPSEKFRELHETVRRCARKELFALMDKETITSFLHVIEQDLSIRPNPSEYADPAYWINEDFDMDAHYPPNTYVIYNAWW